MGQSPRTGSFLRLAILTVGVSVMLGRNGIAATQTLADNWYSDPKGYFRIVPPAGWTVTEYPDEPRGKVAFTGPDDVDLRVLINAVDFDSVDRLESFCRERAQQVGVEMNIKRTEFDHRPAIERSFEYQGQRFRYIDFLVGKVDHNLAYGAPPSQYERYLPVVTKSMETYSPVSSEVSTGDAAKHAAAKQYRLAQIMLENGSTKLAAECVAEGLRADPSHAGLFALKKQIGPPGKQAEGVQGAVAPKAPTSDSEEAARPAAPTDNKPSTPTSRPVEKSDDSPGEWLFGLFALAMFYLFFRRIARGWKRLSQ